MTTTRLVHVLVLLLVGAVGAVGAVGVAAAFGTGRGTQTPGVSVAEAPVAQEKKSADVAALEEVQLTLAARRDEYRPGEPIDLTLTIKNNTKERFAYPAPNLIDLVGLTVAGPDGKDVKHILNPVEISRALSFIAVEPGRTLTVTADQGLRGINLPKAGGSEYLRHVFYPMEAPGNYRVRLRLDKAISNELRIKVRQPDAGAPADSKAVRVNDVDFEAVIDAKMPVPVLGTKHDVYLGLRLTNRGDKPVYFNLLNTIKLGLSSADGKPYVYNWGRDRKTWPGPVLLDKRQSKLVYFPAALGRKKSGPLDVMWLGGSDHAGGFWSFDKLATGKYLLHFIYENTDKTQAAFERDGAERFGLQPGQPFWLGKATTSDVSFEITSPDKLDDPTAGRLKALKDDLASFELHLQWVGSAPRKVSDLIVRTGKQRSIERGNAWIVSVTILPADALKLVEGLAREGFLRTARSPGTDTLAGEVGFTLKVRTERYVQQEVVGADVRLRERLAALRRVLDGDAGSALDGVLAALGIN